MTTKAEYLENENVKLFSLFLTRLLTNDDIQVVNTQTSDPTTTTFAEYVSGYRYKALNFDETQQIIMPISENLKKSIEENDDNLLLRSCLEVFVWGSVVNKASVGWILDKAKKGELSDSVNNAVNALTSDTDDSLNIFEENAIRSDSALTKVYAFIDARSVILDGRVCAALALLVKSMLEYLDLKSVPEELDFMADKSHSKKSKGKRDPSNKQYFFSKKVTGLHHATANLRVNWILNNLAESESMKELFDAKSTSEIARKIETGLFMIGDDIRPLRIKVSHFSSDNNIGNKDIHAAEDNQVQTHVKAKDFFTNGRRTPFRLTINTESVLIQRGAAFSIETTIQLQQIVSVLKKLQEEFGLTEFPLANAVTTVSLVDAPRGLGRTIYENTNNVNTAQAASQLATILYLSNIFGWNQKNNRAKYRVMSVPDVDALRVTLLSL